MRLKFSLGTLLLVVLVLCAAAAVVVYRILQARQEQARIFKLERSASGAIKHLLTAQADLWRNDQDGNGVRDFWTMNVRGLYYLNNMQLIQRSVADADAAHTGRKSPREGYWFVAMKFDKSGMAYDTGEGRNRTSFAFCKYPAVYGAIDATGEALKYTYITSENHQIWKKDTGGQPVFRWPRDPGSEGWMRLR